MSNLSLFPDRLKELIFDNGQMTSYELAEKVGVHFTTVNLWLRGEILISLANAVKLADLFSCSLDYLAGLSEVDRKVPARPLEPFYTRLRAVMKSCGVTRYRIAKETEFKDVYFTKWSRGSIPDLISVIKLAEYLHVSVDYLIGRTDY